MDKFIEDKARQEAIIKDLKKQVDESFQLIEKNKLESESIARLSNNERSVWVKQYEKEKQEIDRLRDQYSKLIVVYQNASSDVETRFKSAESILAGVVQREKVLESDINAFNKYCELKNNDIKDQFNQALIINTEAKKKDEIVSKRLHDLMSIEECMAKKVSDAETTLKALEVKKEKYGIYFKEVDDQLKSLANREITLKALEGKIIEKEAIIKTKEGELVDKSLDVKELKQSADRTLREIQLKDVAI